MSAERVTLVDGSALVYRAFFAIPPHFTTKSGLHTNAIYGFALMFKKLFAGKRPAFGAVVFDAPGVTFRAEKYPQYKAQRAPMPDEMREQLVHIDRVVKANRFPMVRVPGYEADDVIGTLTKQARAAGHDVFIISSDKDFAQLIDDHVKMQDTLKDVVYDRELVRKKWGVLPEQMIDLLALMGDASDNIPGVDGIGQKGAQQLLADHKSLDGIYQAFEANPDAFKGRSKKALADGKASAYLSKELATIDQDAPLPITLDELALVVPDAGELNALYKELEFYSLLSQDDAKEARQGALATAGAADAICGDPGSVVALVERLRQSGKPTAVVPVFDGVALDGQLVGIALAQDDAAVESQNDANAAPGLVAYVPVDDARLMALLPWLQDDKAEKTLHNAKEAWVLLRQKGVTLRGVTCDTMLASFLADPTRLIPHGIEAVVKDVLHRTVAPAKDLTGGGQAQKLLKDVDTTTVAAWAGDTAQAIAAMRGPLLERVRDADQLKHLHDVDLPLSWLLGQMEIDGIGVDTDELAAIGVELRERLAQLVTAIHGHAGRTFNVGSPKQLGEVLFDELKLPVQRRTKSGYSTDAEVLERLLDKHPIAAAVLEHRKLDKLINTYTDVLQREVRSDGRVHATFQQAVGATGRLITTNPDLQRTPIKTPEGQRIREAFVAKPLRDGTPTVIVDADWSQIELRLLAHFSEDPLLVDAFHSGADVHRRTAAQVFGKDEADVTKAERNVGKTVNFSTIYGQGKVALAQILGMSSKEAGRIIDAYFEAYAGVRTWLDNSITTAEDQGYATTLLGRRRVIPELKSQSPMDRGFGERVAANTPIQGSAADICKLAMLNIARQMPRVAPRARMLLQVHDELVFDCPVDEAVALSTLVRQCMENVVPLRVPLVAEVGVGKSWGEAHG